MSEPISDERLAEIRAWVADAESPDQYVIYKAGDILALLARLDRAEAGWQVKPLEWEQPRCGPDEYRTLARAGAFEEGYEIEPPYKGMKSVFRVRRSRDINPFSWAPTLEAAKAAAQDDYEQRIRSAFVSKGS